jgi:hypothetical protein
MEWLVWWSHTTRSEKHDPTGVCWRNMITRTKRTRGTENPDAFIQLNMQIVGVAHFSFRTHVERQLCIVNRGYAIVTKQEWGDRTNKFCSTASRLTSSCKDANSTLNKSCLYGDNIGEKNAVQFTAMAVSNSKISTWLRVMIFAIFQSFLLYFSLFTFLLSEQGNKYGLELEVSKSKFASWT